MTLRQAITNAALRLAAEPALRADAQRDAELLLLETLTLPRTALFTQPDLVLSPDQQSRYEHAVARRLTGEPVQYIVGSQEFYGLPFHVTPAVLIPRPETELLVESVLHALPADRPHRILDVGTGSGAIAVALATHLPHAALTAVDLSPAALEVARENAAANHVLERIRFLESDLLSSLTGEPPFTAVVSNPPYIPDSDRDTLHPQVRNHEPASALFAGPDGLAVYTRLIPQALAALEPNGLLALEFGYGQRAALAGLLSDWNGVRFLDDLQQIPRVALARKP